MSKAFIFPGQGAQFVGMGADIAKSFDIAAKIFHKADEIVGYKISQLCFEGPEDKLNSTTYSQPAIFTISAAILEVVKSQFNELSQPNVTAGLSLGEYTALFTAGLINFEDTLTLVQKRGRYMQEAAELTKGGMLSIIGLEEAQVNQICEKARQGQILKPVNFNCPGQIVVSGTIDACERAKNLAEKSGAIKAVMLKVAGAFHTEMMSSAAEALEHALSGCEISNPSNIKTIANINAQYYIDAESIRRGLIKQLISPILWQKSMERLINEGIDTFYEIGPGRILTGLMRRINRKVSVINISNADALAKLLCVES